ncbi:guanitoxin biosynthesis L-enduracididine beta-hydroxylase GntD [Actinosynnema sp. NPDC050801]|uniref:guanitoxin biosynthesis L-enduracididine beta-hydroxylase GntD n=1 Tax=unclassified Actinosynnema TaxID=2637065 RepID=UPI0033F9E3DB
MTTNSVTTHGVVRLDLDEDGARQALDLASACAARYADVDDPGFGPEAAVIAHDLPRQVRAAANQVRLAEGVHALLLRGHRVDEGLEPTPRHWRDAGTPGSRPYAFLLALYASLLGDLIGWRTQQDGRLVTDVLPIAGLEHSLVSAGSRSELAWHTEDAFSPHRADHVGLLCLRSPDETPTTITHLGPGDLPDDVLEVLGQPRFHVLPDTSHTAQFSAPAGGDATAFAAVERMRERPPLVAVVGGSPQAPTLRVDRDFMVADEDDEQAARALWALVEQLDRNVYEVTLAPGDVCFLDNHSVAHGRRPFGPRYDGNDRWLKRVNTVRDVRRTRPGRSTAETRVIG